MPTAMAKERAAIKRIADRHPGVGLSRLARRIVGKDFQLPSEDFNDCVAANVPTRTYYSVYSVLRRNAGRLVPA